ncbi:MAG: hypothetical protein V4844_14570 [Pseudomonadota bacterium]
MTVEVPSPSARRRRGRPALDTDQLRTLRLNVDLNQAELSQCQQRADTAALPLRRWARRVLIGTPIAATRPAELRALWTESSTLQANFNQLVERLNFLHQAGELDLTGCERAFRDLAHLVPELHQLVCSMRVELAALGRSS